MLSNQIKLRAIRSLRGTAMALIVGLLVSAVCSVIAGYLSGGDAGFNRLLVVMLFVLCCYLMIGLTLINFLILFVPKLKWIFSVLFGLMLLQFYTNTLRLNVISLVLVINMTTVFYLVFKQNQSENN